MLTRILGVLLLFGSAAAGSVFYREEGKRELWEIRAFLTVCERLWRDMEESRRPIPAVLAALPPDVLSACLGGVKVRPYTSMADFLSACPEHGPALEDALADLRELGDGSLSDELRTLSAVRKRLSALYAQREKQIREQTGVVRTCLLGGAGLLAILLW